MKKEMNISENPRMMYFSDMPQMTTAGMNNGIYGFVAPDGTYFSCDKNGHIKLVDELIKKFSLKGHARTPEELLARNGFMTVNQCLVGIDYFGDDFRKYKHLSDAQVEWIGEHMDELNPHQRVSARLELEY